MTFQVINRHHWNVMNIGESLGIIKPHQQGTHKPWSHGYGDTVQVGHTDLGPGKRLPDHRHDISEVFPGGKFRHDAPVGVMNPDLRLHNV